jgi:hypothetical protein
MVVDPPAELLGTKSPMDVPFLVPGGAERMDRNLPEKRLKVRIIEGREAGLRLRRLIRKARTEGSVRSELSVGRSGESELNEERPEREGLRQTIDLYVRRPFRR